MAISNRSELAEFVAKRASQYWVENQLIQHLTNLGSEITRQIEPPKTLKEIAPEGLLNFIRANCPAQIQLHKHPEKDGVWGVAPKDVPIVLSELVKLFRTPESEVAGLGMHRRSYPPFVWSAFKDPIDPDRRRVLFLGHPGRFVDLPRSEPIPDGGIEIRRDFIAQRTGLVPVDAARQIFASIGAFLVENRIDADQLGSGKLERAPSTSVDVSLAPEEIQHASDLPPKYFSQFIQAMMLVPERDRGRISIPVDILVELFERK